MRETLLIVNASPLQTQDKQAFENALPYQMITVPKMNEALEWIKQKRRPALDVVVLDMQANVSGDSLLSDIASLKALKPDLPVVVLTAYGHEEVARQAVAAGVFDCMAKPAQLDRLRVMLQNALKLQRMSRYIGWLERKVSGHVGIEDMVGSSDAFVEARNFAHQASSSRLPVWIDGEPGTGKTLLARAIHGSSDRADKPFVELHCEMMPEHLASEMLLGRQDNGSKNSHFILGKIREADQGTLLLQEIGALPPKLHAAIAELLSQGTITPLGGDPVPVDVRIIVSSTHTEKYHAQQSALREMLGRQTQLLSHSLAPLRQRRRDIASLANHFLLVHATSENKYISNISDGAIAWLEENEWPGNIGQLANLIWRAVMLCESTTIEAREFKALQKQRTIYLGEGKDEIRTGEGSVLIDGEGRVRTLKSIQEEAIRFALQKADGCMTRAARSLGIGRSTLYRKVSEFSIEPYISRENHTTRPTIKQSSTLRS